MQKIRKIVLANSEKSALQDERTDKGEFIGHLRLEPGDQKCLLAYGQSIAITLE